LHEKCAHSVHLSTLDALPENSSNAENDPSERPEAIQIWRSLTPELRRVVRSLPRLPEPVKAGIMAMVEASGGTV